MAVGVDIGGTFTDLVGYRDGKIRLSKTLSTPADPTEGVARSLDAAGLEIAELDEFLHGTTVAINTVLERKGAMTAFVTTEGFRDIYEIGRGNRPENFNIFFHRPRPLVPRDRCYELRERMNARGEALVALDQDEVRRLGAQLEADGVQAVAICLLHSYANPAHEILVARLLRAAHPQLFVTASHEILREFREYERSSTTVLNAYVGPRARDYLQRLEAHLSDQGFRGAIQIMRSNGGSMSLRNAAAQPVSMMESGPVAGMIGAGQLAGLLGLSSAIGFDMGGTTAKAALLTDGAAAIEEGYFIGGYATGQPMQLPVVDIVEVGAGGGSVAWRDPAGGLHVGPRSAGAEPGPACYGRGGTEPTVTDANLVLGRLNAQRFLGGGMPLDAACAGKAIEDMARPLGLSLSAAAAGIVRIADAAMALAVRAVSVKKGVDPRDAAMIAFGGAGPLHAVALAREIYVPRVVIPKLPGNFSALGMLLSAWRHDSVRTLVGIVGKLDPKQVGLAYDELIAAARKQLAADSVDAERAAFAFAADLRYRGQEHAITVPVAGADAFARSEEAVRARFHELHELRYGHAAAEETIEIVNVRLTVTVARDDPELRGYLGAPFHAEDPRPEQKRDVVFDDAEQPLATRILWRPGLAPGFRFEGPAVIEEPNSTTLVFPGNLAEITAHGHIVITL
ncbi:MAG: hypothetical protein A3G26_02160 [Betaproteobacteria bacterium RIFCSPLOWO2_12_FULL_65_110]|nr:MAG: hypothetical protein A3H33_05115 [Betaproteobacteria bacterium RIFCSPLOWO2_02_FULL_65_20]OGA38174.1 MAG: hypothetical protein A3G26_02160 [Betaproteobacteria bacterium RIFCSPLOWO2_12_FULL_65_110]